MASAALGPDGSAPLTPEMDRVILERGSEGTFLAVLGLAAGGPLALLYAWYLISGGSEYLSAIFPVLALLVFVAGIQLRLYASADVAGGAARRISTNFAIESWPVRGGPDLHYVKVPDARFAVGSPWLLRALESQPRITVEYAPRTHSLFRIYASDGALLYQHPWLSQTEIDRPKQVAGRLVSAASDHRRESLLHESPTTRHWDEPLYPRWATSLRIGCGVLFVGFFGMCLVVGGVSRPRVGVLFLLVILAVGLSSLWLLHPALLHRIPLFGSRHRLRRRAAWAALGLAILTAALLASD